MEQKREKFSTRLGFLLISAGCAIGIGNVWRFPYIAGKYGGAFFVLIYLFFLVVLGIPIMTMEFAVGRASQKSVAQSFDVLEPKGSKWHTWKYFAITGNYLLMMFYTTVAGWMINYFFKIGMGKFTRLDAKGVEAVFGSMLGNPTELIVWMIVAVLLGMFVVGKGLQNGVEKITKAMMGSLVIIMIVLVIRSVTLQGASEGLAFYLKPNLQNLKDNGILNVVSAAMDQAFFTLSIGMGNMAIFGSYIDKDRSLLGESVNVTVLDTAVAIMSGLIIFPACFAFGVNPGQGPGLVFVTLPNVFNSMMGGRLWGTLFFLFMSFAAMSTIIAVFENIISYAMDLWGWSRKKAVLINLILILILSLPCALGFNLWSGFQPLGPNSGVLDLEDFIVSSNILPIGSLVYLAFCVLRGGWGYDKFLSEVNTGKGMKLKAGLRAYFNYIIPLMILFIWAYKYYGLFFA